MRPFILLLKKVGLLRIVSIFIAVALIIAAVLYVKHQPKVLDPALQAKFNQGKYAEAIPGVEAWVKENPKDVNAMETLAALYVQKATNEPQVQSETLSKAMNLVATIVKLDPSRSEAYRILGNAYFMKGNTKLATENFVRAVQASKGKNLDAYANLAMVYEYNKDWDKASIQYLNILKKDSKNEMANLGVARFYISKNQEKEALNYAWKVANSSSNNASLGEAYSIIAAGMKILGNNEISKTYYEKSISYRPNNVHTLILLGEAYFNSFPSVKAQDRQQTIDKITALANQAITLEPTYIHGQTLLYKSFLLQGKYDEANKVGIKIVSLLPTDTTLTPAQKAEYKKYYSGKITDVKITSVKITQPGASTSTTVILDKGAKGNPFTKTKK